MTPFAVLQRAARLAPELDRIMSNGALIRRAGEPLTWTTEEVLRALYAAGLTLDADVGGASVVKAAQERLAAG